jgi:hypothetical protein
MAFGRYSWTELSLSNPKIGVSLIVFTGPGRDDKAQLRVAHAQLPEKCLTVNLVIKRMDRK